MANIQYHAWLQHVPPYKAGASTIAGFENPIKISSNENAYGTSPRALEAYQKSADKLHLYPNGDSVILKQALADTYQIDESKIICGAGSDNLLELCGLCFLTHGDNAVFSTHSFPLYEIITRLSGATPVKVPYKADLSHDIDGIIKACTENTKVIFLANPDNPTGRYVSYAEIQRLIQSVPSHILIVLDEAYYEFADAADYQTGLPFVEQYPNVMVTRTFSKMFGLASLRVGWGYLPAVVYDAFSRARTPFNVNIPAQYAATAALQDKAWQMKNISDNLRQRQLFESFLHEHGYDYIPSQANFVLVYHPKAAELYEFFQKNGVIVRYMAGNGLPEYLRFSLGTPEQMQIVCGILKKYQK